MKELKCAYKFANFRQIENFRIVINETEQQLGTHERTHNAPTLNEVAILLPNNQVGHHDIVLHTRSDQLQRSSEFHTAYDCDSIASIYLQGRAIFYCRHVDSSSSSWLMLMRKLNVNAFNISAGNKRD